MKKCLQCGTEYDGNFCPQCGAANQQGMHCPNCGALIGEKAEFCANCGKKLHSVPEKEVKIDPSTEKLLHKLYFVPSLLFILFAVLLQIFYSMAAAKNDLISKYGDSNEVMDVYWICKSEYNSTLPLTFAIIAIVLAVALAALLTLKPLRSKAITVTGKKHSIGSMISLLLPIAYLPYLIIGISLNSFVKGWELLGYKVGAAVPLIIVFSILFMLTTAALGIFLFLCERGACGKRWQTIFYSAGTQAQEDAKDKYRKISRMVTYANYPWLRSFAWMQFIAALTWCIAPIIAALKRGKISLLLDALFPNSEFAPSLSLWNTEFKTYLYVCIFSFILLPVLGKRMSKTTDFIVTEQGKKKKYIFGALFLYTAVTYFRAIVLNSKNSFRIIYYYDASIINIISFVLLVMASLLISKRIFRKAKAYQKDLSEHFYGKNPKAGAMPIRTSLEDLERTAKGEVIASTESKDQAQCKK